jgi:endonuclease/exonuclease/phosphatase family metal-dependent hydrolase
MPTVLTWNLQGGRGVDIDAVAAVIEGADIAALQEVQRRQALALAGALGWQVVWTFKHHPIRTAAEGLAVLAPEVEPLGPVIKLRGGLPWSYRRRVALPVTTGDLVVVDVHLGSGSDDGARQARLLVDNLETRGRSDNLVVAGDLNAGPESTVLDTFLRAGLRDAWSGPPGSGATNWSASRRGGPPTQRLDYVLVSNELDVVHASVPPVEQTSAFASLSDHVPLTVRLA